jgi:hypothetical protein
LRLRELPAAGVRDSHHDAVALGPDGAPIDRPENVPEVSQRWREDHSPSVVVPASHVNDRRGPALGSFTDSFDTLSR